MVHPWKLAIKPGKPTALGSVGETCFVGLPGYPVAAQVAFMIFARPVILKLSGATADPVGPSRFRVPAAAPFSKNHSKRQFVRARLQIGPNGETQAVPYESQGTSVELSLTDSDGLVDMREDVRQISPGEYVYFIPYNSMQH
jgi:molybdopterin molybdotransferase